MRRLWVLSALLLAAGCASSLAPREESVAALRVDDAALTFDQGSARLALASGQAFSIALASFGRGTPAPLDTGVPRCEGGTVHVVRETTLGVDEWWTSLGAHLEHGVTVSTRPEGPGPLLFDLDVEGLSARSIDGRSVALLDGEAQVAEYGGLVVLDATGRDLPASMTAIEGGIRIRVDDRDASYPLVVDPFVLAVETTFPNASGVALSADGSVAAIIVPGGTVTPGVLTVYRRSGTTWTQDFQFTGTLSFGAAVALSPAGDVVAALDQVGAMGGVHLYAWRSTGPMAWSTIPSVTGNFQRGLAIGGNTAFVGVSPSGIAPVTIGASTLTVNPTLAVGAVVSRMQATTDGSRVMTDTQIIATAGTGTVESTFFPTNGITGISGDGLHAAYYDGSSGNRVFLYYRTGTTWNLGTIQTVGGGLLSALAFSRDGGRLFVSASNSLQAFTPGATPTSPWIDGGTYGSVISGGLAQADNLGERVIVAGSNGATMRGTLLLTVTLPTGTACTAAGAACSTGFCVDGFCCASACGGGSTTDCQACAMASTGQANGTCAALSAAVAPTVTCRGAAGVCDLAEVCASTSTSCPTDAFVSSSTVCHPSAGACDVAETCTGSSAACPGDVLAASGTVCRPAAGACDLAETCNGTLTACPVDNLQPAGTSCRPMAGDCDVAEVCTGTAVACPADALAANHTACGSPPSGPCDVQDECDGTSMLCQARFQAAGTECAPAGTDVCDAPDVCTGSTANCPPTFATAVVCRPATGGCDVAESCSGTASSCPPDVLLGAGVACRPSTGMSCDPAETCDGTETSCPADVNTCAPVDAGGGNDAGTIIPVDAGLDAATSDAGPRDGGGSDASVGSDGGATPPVVTGGCGCAATRARGPGLAVVLLGLGLVLAGRRRARSRA